MDVSVIIVSYNSLELTRACIRSIREHVSGLSYEIIVVDNDSRDGTAAALANDGGVILVEAGSNLGFGRANNLGLSHAAGEYILFLNSDTILTRNALADMLAFCRSGVPNVGGVGLVLTGSDGRRTHSFGTFVPAAKAVCKVMEDHLCHLFRRPKRLLSDDTAVCFDRPLVVDYVTGADLFTARSVLDAAGAFDPEFFLYFEETEMQHRWKRAGFDQYVLPLGGIIHLEGATTGHSASASRRILTLRSTKLYYRKTLSASAYALFSAGYAFVNLPMLVDRSLTGAQRRECRKILF